MLSSLPPEVSAIERRSAWTRPVSSLVRSRRVEGPRRRRCGSSHISPRNPRKDGTIEIPDHGDRGAARPTLTRKIVDVSLLIRGRVLSQADVLINDLGGDAETMLAAHGIDPSAIEDINRYIRYQDAGAVLGHAARELDAPDFGLRLGGKQGLETLGPLGVIMRNSETVGAAVERLCHFLRAMVPSDTAVLTQSTGTSAFSYSVLLSNDFDRRQMLERAFGLAMRAYRVLIGPTFVPNRVTFEHQRYAPLATYHEVFGCQVDFKQERNAIHLSPVDLARVIDGRDYSALVLAEDYLKRLVPEPAVADHVREVTRRLLMVGGASLPQVARELSLHERTLERHLRAHGTTFEAILDDLRRAAAWELAATGMQASQIARAIGYSEQSSLSRACRRWFGESPRELLRRRRGQRPEEAPAARHPDP